MEIVQNKQVCLSIILQFIYHIFYNNNHRIEDFWERVTEIGPIWERWGYGNEKEKAGENNGWLKWLNLYEIIMRFEIDDEENRDRWGMELNRRNDDEWEIHELSLNIWL